MLLDSWTQIDLVNQLDISVRKLSQVLLCMRKKMNNIIDVCENCLHRLSCEYSINNMAIYSVHISADVQFSYQTYSTFLSWDKTVKSIDHSLSKCQGVWRCNAYTVCCDIMTFKLVTFKVGLCNETLFMCTIYIYIYIYIYNSSGWAKI